MGANYDLALLYGLEHRMKQERQLKKDVEMKEKIKQQELIRSQLNRAEASLKQLKESDIFTEADREILIPRYQSEINLLKEKLFIINQ